MGDRMPVSAEIDRVFARAGVPAPAGADVQLDDGGTALWLSGEPATVRTWCLLRAAHPATGWWPLLLAPADERPWEFRPWASRELSRAGARDPATIDVAALLARWWTDSRDARGAPGRPWTGLAPAAPAGDPVAAADRAAADLLAAEPQRRLGLVRAARGADALSAAGWQGAASRSADVGAIAAVLRSWEERFGARVVGAGPDTLWVGVAAPPADRRAAELLAAEHAALCPDSPRSPAVTARAADLLDAAVWQFRWAD